MKIIRNILTIFLVIMLLTSCSGTMTFEIPENAQIDGGFEYGIFQGFLVYPIGVLINHLTIWLGSSAIAMIITTLIVRSITLPFTIKAQLATRGMQEMQPKIQEIEAKYKGRTDANATQQKQKEIQKIYSEMDGNPMMGILTQFLTFPLFMAVWRATSYATVIKGAEPIFGISLGKTPMDAFAAGEYYYLVVLVLVAVTQFVSFKLSNHLSTKRNKEAKNYKPNPQADKMAKNMGFMVYGFTGIMLVMSFTLITAMSLYLICSALISIGQAYYIDHKMREAN